MRLTRLRPHRWKGFKWKGNRQARGFTSRSAPGKLNSPKLILYLRRETLKAGIKSTWKCSWHTPGRHFDHSRKRNKWFLTGLHLEFPRKLKLMDCLFMDLIPLSDRARVLDLYLDLQTPKSHPPIWCPYSDYQKRRNWAEETAGPITPRTNETPLGLDDWN